MELIVCEQYVEAGVWKGSSETTDLSFLEQWKQIQKRLASWGGGFHHSLNEFRSLKGIPED